MEGTDTLQVKAVLGAWRWRRHWENIGELRVPVWDSLWDPKAVASCARCEDRGEWIGQDGDVEPCPSCGGKNRNPPTPTEAP